VGAAAVVELLTGTLASFTVAELLELDQGDGEDEQPETIGNNAQDAKIKAARRPSRRRQAAPPAPIAARPNSPRTPILLLYQGHRVDLKAKFMTKHLLGFGNLLGLGEEWCFGAIRKFGKAKRAYAKGRILAKLDPSMEGDPQ
jgi:hypothetical protein